MSKLVLRHKLIVFCSLISLLLYLYSNGSTREDEDQINPDQKFTDPRVKQKLYDSNFTQYCEEFGEWDMISNRKVFLKRTAAYYFIDTDILKLFFMTHSAIKLDMLAKELIFKVILITDSKIVTEQTVPKGDIEVRRLTLAVGEYGNAFFQLKLSKTITDLTQMYIKKEFESMRLIVVNKVTKLRTRYALNVKIKYLVSDATKKKGAMLCEKCSFHLKQEHLSDLEWWIKIHKKIGYDKKYLCAHVIDKEDPQISKLIDKYNEFLEVAELKCIPNLQDYAHLGERPYLKHYNEITDGNKGSFYRAKYCALEFLNVNECYLDNVDKYRYVAVYDKDEFILPEQIRQFNTYDKIQQLISNIDDYSKSNPFEDVSCDQNYNIERFLEQNLKRRLNLKNKDVSLHFKHGSYIYNNIIVELFSLLKSKLRELNLTDLTLLVDKKLVNLTIEVIDKTRIHKFRLDRPFLFTINGAKELDYAISLMKLYENIIQPFLTKHSVKLNAELGTFNRLFHVSGDLNDHVAGKTIHNTRRSMDLFIHWSTGYFEIDKILPKIVHSNGVNENRDYVVPRELSHLLHFRDHLNFDEPQSRVPFSTFHFDLNYFKCFVAPMLLL